MVKQIKMVGNAVANLGSNPDQWKNGRLCCGKAVGTEEAALQYEHDGALHMQHAPVYCCR